MYSSEINRLTRTPGQVLLAMFSAALLTTSAAAQGEPWRHPDRTMHFYRVFTVAGGVTWTEANALAAREGGYLATIDSQEENAVIANLLTDPLHWSQNPIDQSFNGPWIGGVQSPTASDPAHGWAWPEGNAVTYAPWSASEPDDQSGGLGNADRIHFGGASTPVVNTWADAPADARLPGYVVEWSGSSVPLTVGVTRRDPGFTEGYTLLAGFNSTSTYLLDSRGQTVNTWASAYRPGQVAKLLPNGNLLRCGNVGHPAPPGGGGGGIVEEFDWAGNKLWSYQLSTADSLLHHDVYRLPNGNTLMLLWARKTRTECIDAGRNPALLIHNHLWPDKILEVRPTGLGTGSIVWEWDPFDHLIQDFDASKANYGDPAKHPELIDINYTEDGVGISDWMHANAIDYNAALDQIVISLRAFDEFWIIDHSTTTAEAASHSGGRSGRGGDLLYRWGNPMTYRAGTLADRRLFKQHNAHWIPPGLPGAGNILLFNNGVERPQGHYSTADEIVLPTVDANGNYPRPGAAWGPAGPVWSYVPPDPDRFFSFYVSSVQRLANGNTFVCSGFAGRIREVDPLGVAKWDYVNPVTTVNALQGDPTRASERALFRAPWYPPDYPAFQGRTLVPEDPLERHNTVLLVDGSTLPQSTPVGGTASFTLRAGSYPNQSYLLGTSLSQGLFAIDNRFARMGWDSIAELSMSGQATGTFQGYVGTLDANGRARASVSIPNIPGLSGVDLYTTMFVIQPNAASSVGWISNTVKIEIIR